MRFTSTLAAVVSALVVCVAAFGAQDTQIIVGVYPGIGDAGILAALNEAQGIQAQALPSYSPEALSALDVVVIPHGAEVADADRSRSWRTTLRRYVELGGAVVLTHGAAGFRGVFADNELFPEIELATGKKDAFTFARSAGSEHPLAAKLPALIRHGYCDHVTMDAGPLGEVICVDDEGDVTVVAGTFGKGRVVAMGAIPGWRSKVQEPGSYDGEAAPPEDSERTLLVEAVRWAGSAGGFDRPQMARELEEAARTPRRMLLLAFTSDFNSYTLSPKEWIVPGGPGDRQAWRGRGMGGVIGEVGEVSVHDQPIVSRTFREPIERSFSLRFTAPATARHAGIADITLTDDQGDGYGVRLVYISENDPIDTTTTTRAKTAKVEVGEAANSILRIDGGKITPIAEAKGALSRLRMPNGLYTKIPVRLDRGDDGWLTLRVGGRVIAAACDTTFDRVTRLAVNMSTPNGRLAIDDVRLLGLFGAGTRRPPTPLTVFETDFEPRCGPTEWTSPCPTDSNEPERAWRRNWIGRFTGDTGNQKRVGEVHLANEPLVSKEFKKAPLEERFTLTCNAAVNRRYAGALDIMLTNGDGDGYGMRLVYISSRDKMDTTEATRHAEQEERVAVGAEVSSIFEVAKGRKTILARAEGEASRILTSKSRRKAPVRFERTDKGRLRLHINGQVVAEAQGPDVEGLDRLTLSMPTENGRMALDDVRLIGLFEDAGLSEESSPRPVVLPEPKQITLSGEKFPLVDGAQFVVAGEEKIKAYCLDEFMADIGNRYGVKMKAVVKGKEDETLPMVSLGETAEADAELGDEGYTIEITPTSARIRGATEAGTFYGLTTLFQLLERKGEDVSIRAAAIRDWPDLSWRGALTDLKGSDDSMPHMKRLIKMMARMKGNVLIIGNRHIQVPSVPLFKGPYGCAWTLEGFGKLVEYARAHHIDVWPRVMGLTHSGWVGKGRKIKTQSPEFWAWMKEHHVLGAPDDDYRGADAFNPASPEAIDLIERMGDDVIKATGAKTVHIGMDELKPPISRMAPGRDPAEVLAEYINEHHAHLAKQGVRMAMYVDMLLEGGKYGGSCAVSNTKWGPDATHPALEMIPKDIILFDWYYGESPERKSYAYLKSKGFDVVGMPSTAHGYLHESVYNGAVAAKRDGIDGIICFGWDTGRWLSPQSTYILPFVYGWTVPDKMKPDWSVAKVWQDLYQWPIPSRVARVEPIDISSKMNESRHDAAPGDGVGWFDLGPEADFSALDAGELTYGKLRFDVADEATNGGRGVIMAATVDVDAKVGERIEEIPVNTKAKSLIFLHTATPPRPPDPYRNVAGWPFSIGHYTVHYDDGTSVEIPLNYGHNIGPWRFEEALPNIRTTWFFKYGQLSDTRRVYVSATKLGERVALQSYEWVNPHPDKTITTVDLVALDPKESVYVRNVRIALLALSAAK